MNYTQFLSAVEAHMRSYFSESYTLSIQTILRNNNTSLDGLVIFKPGSNISPTIYLNPYYHRFLDGVSMEDICDDIYCAYNTHCPENNVDTDFFDDFSRVRDHIVIKLINYEHNQVLLQDVPHIRFLDLAIVFQVYVTNQIFGSGTVLIHHNHMQVWDTTTEELYRLAQENTPRILGTYCEPINNCIQSLTEEIGIPYCPPGECGMKILSNEEKTYGAAAILYQGVLKALSDKDEQDLLILPSSIHEVILLPVEEHMDFTFFTEMIQEINETQLQDDEILSDHPYYYSRLTGQITAIA